MSILDSAINFVAGVIHFPSEMYWRLVFWRMKRPRKSRYPDEEIQLAEAISIGHTLQENVCYLGALPALTRAMATTEYQASRNSFSGTPGER